MFSMCVYLQAHAHTCVLRILEKQIDIVKTMQKGRYVLGMYVQLLLLLLLLELEVDDSCCYWCCCGYQFD